MIESLGPLVSLFKVLTDGLAKAINLPTGYRRKQFNRKIVVLQIQLEDIIDSAHVILELIENTDRDEKGLLTSADKVNEFVELIEGQCSNISCIFERLCDPDVVKILKTFSPKTRRRIQDLLEGKKAVLTELGYNLKSIARSLELTCGLDPRRWSLIDFSGWEHEKFIDNGKSFIATLRRDRSNPTQNYCLRLSKQNEVLKELEDCSVELSIFIDKHINLNDVLKLKKCI